METACQAQEFLPLTLNVEPDKLSHFKRVCVLVKRGDQSLAFALIDSGGDGRPPKLKAIDAAGAAERLRKEAEEKLAPHFTPMEKDKLMLAASIDIQRLVRFVRDFDGQVDGKIEERLRSINEDRITFESDSLFQKVMRKVEADRMNAARERR
jgi:hypothetical protein